MIIVNKTTSMIEPRDNFPQTHEEFGEFIIRNQNRLVRHAFFRLGNREEAEDLVQDVMIRAYRERIDRKHIEKATSYVFRMVFNACMDRLRKSTRAPLEPLNGKEMITDVKDPGPEARIIAGEEFRRINAVLDSIPPEQADVVRLRIIDEMSFVEIAGLLNEPVTTRKSRFTYGILKLRTKISKKEEVNYELR